jgi:hypothetical protein
MTNGLTGGTLFALAGLHVAWGLGSPLPFVDSETLADAVVGTKEVPPPSACVAVAAALAVGGAMVIGVPVAPAPLRRVGLLVMAGVFAVRAGLGFAGRTELVSPGSSSVRFKRLDQILYSPLCAALAAGSVAACRQSPVPRRRGRGN